MGLPMFVGKNSFWVTIAGAEHTRRCNTHKQTNTVCTSCTVPMLDRLATHGPCALR